MGRPDGIPALVVSRFLGVLAELDELIASGADLTSALGAAARLLCCTAGVATREISLSVQPNGQTANDYPPPSALRHELSDAAELWLLVDPDSLLMQLGDPFTEARDFQVRPVDAVFGRLAGVYRVAVGEAFGGRAADMHLIVDAMAGDADREGALRRLGMHGGTEVTVLALLGPPTGVDQAAAALRAASSSMYHTRLGRISLLLARDLDLSRDIDVPVGVCCGFSPLSPARTAPDAWRRTRSALRFALPSTHDRGPYSRTEAVLVDSSMLGAYAVLAEQLTADAILANPDVTRLRRLLAESGEDMLETLLAVAANDSLRHAARRLHLHHNSVGHRVHRAEKVLGYACTEPYGRARLLLTLTLYRLLESHRLF